MSDGKDLEYFIAFVEQTLGGEGVIVESRKRLFTKKGIPKAEFDVAVSGKVGSVDMNVLLECRDRQKAAPSNWSEQLQSRRGAS